MKQSKRQNLINKSFVCIYAKNHSNEHMSHLPKKPKQNKTKWPHEPEIEIPDRMRIYKKGNWEWPTQEAWEQR